ncbi:hypothetical protein EI94DRAFT_1834397 [Lactarius quietus]|nr:hypothetical protein EI94DRAFT_1834397 [Lactarius quietus]
MKRPAPPASFPEPNVPGAQYQGQYRGQYYDPPVQAPVPTPYRGRGDARSFPVHPAYHGRGDARSFPEAPAYVYNVRDVKIPFRVLIVGRANAGKTTILQRVCDTTESPIIYREGKEVKLDPSVNRGEHEIDDELVFSNHRGYVFHDSKGIEAGDAEELEILKDFIRRKCEEKRLRKKLHAIWYCVPMDNHRPGLDIKFYDKICPDPDVPVIVVFTKYDQFLLNVEMDVDDDPDIYPDGNVSEETQRRFEECYLGPLGSDDRYVRLEDMHLKESRCDKLIEKTAATLSGYVAALMISAAQKGNLELGVKTALTRVYARAHIGVELVVRGCLLSFPWIWEELVTDCHVLIHFKPSDDTCP